MPATIIHRGVPIEMPWTHSRHTKLASGDRATGGKFVRIANRTYDRADFVTMPKNEKHRLLVLDRLLDFVSPGNHSTVRHDLGIEGPVTADMMWYWINRPGKLKVAEEWLAEHLERRAQRMGV